MESECILTPGEIDFYAASIQPSDFETIGTSSWFEAHERLQRLYQQATLEASKNIEEHVKEAIISNLKLQILVYEAVFISVWKQRILPRILKQNPNTENTFPIYIIFYHEAVVVGLLQTVLYHSEGCEYLQDSAVELVDYCILVLTRIAISSRDAKELKKDKLKASTLEELRAQEETLLFGIGASCLGIIRYLVENLDCVPVTVATRLYSDNDVPLLVCQLIDQESWTRRNAKGDTYKYTDSEWKKITDVQEMTKTEAQLWLAMHQLLLNKHIIHHYELTESRKNRLGRLNRFLHELLLDQLPPLIDLKRWLSQLAVAQVPTMSSKRPFIVELSTEFRSGLETSCAGRWDDIAEEHARRLLQLSRAETVKLANSLSNAFESLADVCDAGPKCANCGDRASQKCSRCKNEWYCGRPCQVKQWKNHKEHCNTVSGVKECESSS
nr:PREDICTED: zinc finger MYND domain-containing protein 10 [Bemisia tabaci]